MGTNYEKDDHEGLPADVYSVIKSAEIREYLRNEEELDIYEKIEIIFHSYISMHQKLAILKQLSDTGNAEEAGQINEAYDILSEYMNQIYNPAVRTIFLLEIEWPYLEDYSIEKESEFVSAYDTVDELIEMMEVYSENEMDMSLYGYVSVVQVPQDKKLRQPFGFTLFWIDGKCQVKDIDIHEEVNLRAQGDRDVFLMMDGIGVRRYPLPFEDGSRLKLQLPFMEEPFYGILSSVDACGWYHHLYDENDTERKDLAKSINLTYASIDLGSRYSSLDWIERA